MATLKFSDILDFIKNEIIAKAEPKAKSIEVTKVGEKPHKFAVTSEYLATYKVGRKKVELPVDVWVDDINTLMFECKYGRFSLDLR